MNSLELNLVRARDYNVKNNQGFTLLEMALVIILIGILLSAAVYGFVAYERSANNLAAKQNYAKIMTAKVTWCSQNQGAAAPTLSSIGVYLNDSGNGGTTASSFRLSGVTPTITLGSCGGSGDIVSYDGTLFGGGANITCTSTADSPVVNDTICVSS